MRIYDRAYVHVWFMYTLASTVIRRIPDFIIIIVIVIVMKRLFVCFLPRDALQCKARSCDHMSVCPSVTLVDADHIR